MIQEVLWSFVVQSSEFVYIFYPACKGSFEIYCWRKGSTLLCLICRPEVPSHVESKKKRTQLFQRLLDRAYEIMAMENDMVMYYRCLKIHTPRNMHMCMTVTAHMLAYKLYACVNLLMHPNAHLQKHGRACLRTCIHTDTHVHARMHRTLSVSPLLSFHVFPFLSFHHLLRHNFLCEAALLREGKWEDCDEV